MTSSLHSVSVTGGCAVILCQAALAWAPQALSFGAEVVLDGRQGTGSVAADFDADGQLDLAYGNSLAGDARLRVLRGLGGGQYAPHWEECLLCASGDWPVLLAAGDFDGDGDVDLIHSLTTSVLQVALNSGAGQFSAGPTSSGALTHVQWLEVVDFDGDGAPDVLVGSSLNGNPNDRIVLLRNLGGAAFAAPESLPAPFYAPRATAVDLDLDGQLELVLAERDAQRLTVLQRDPSGSFVVVATHPLGRRVVDVASGDLDGDGLPDLVFAGALTDEVVVVRNLGGLSFATSDVVAVGDRPVRVITTDLDLDGLLDLVTANENDDSVTTALGNGDGTFRPGRHVPVGWYPGALLALDYEGDGDRDLLVGQWRGGAQRLLRNRGDGTFVAAPEQRLSIGGLAHDVAAGDLDGDGLPELVAIDRDLGEVSVLQNLGSRAFGPRVGTPTMTTRPTLALRDLDGDGHVDVVVTGEGSGGALVLYNRGDGTLEPPAAIALGVDGERLALGDFDGDGRLDVAVTSFVALANSSRHDVHVCLQPSARTFQALAPLAAGGFVSALWATDVDGDGALDLALDESQFAVNSHLHWLHAYGGRGDGTFSSEPHVRTPKSGPIWLGGDADGDGLAELVSLSYAGAWVQQTLGGGRFDDGAPYRVRTQASAIALVDVDGDAAPDLFMTHAHDGTVSVARGDGTGGFVGRTVVGFGREPRGVTAVDLDGDGLPDLLGYDRVGGAVLVRFNGVR